MVIGHIYSFTWTSREYCTNVATGCFLQGSPCGICGARNNDIVSVLQANSEKGLEKTDGGFLSSVTFVLLIYLFINTRHWKNITFRNVTPCSPVNALTRNGTDIKTGLQI